MQIPITNFYLGDLDTNCTWSPTYETITLNRRKTYIRPIFTISSFIHSKLN